MATEYTDAEVKAKFIAYVKWVIDKTIERNLTPEQACTEVAFGILGGLEGGTDKLPQMVLFPLPHKEDKMFMIQHHAEHYWPENHEAIKSLKGTISGPLRQELYKLF